MSSLERKGMTNYQKYGSFEELRSAVLKDVHEAWLENKKFVAELGVALKAVFDVSRYATKRFCPEAVDILAVLKLLRPSEVKIFCGAQDPYPRLDDAVGIAFHSPSSKCPASARAINSCLIKHGHLGKEHADNADFISYVKQGVFLWNKSLTTIEGESGAHGSLWGATTLYLLSSIPSQSVALLLGNDARSLRSSLPSKKVIEHVHPAARVKGAFEEKDVFGLANKALMEMKLAPIKWSRR